MDVTECQAGAVYAVAESLVRGKPRARPVTLGESLRHRDSEPSEEEERFYCSMGDGYEIKHLTGLSPWTKNPPSERHQLQEARRQDESLPPSSDRGRVHPQCH